jgi:serine/threonine protein kinase
VSEQLPRRFGPFLLLELLGSGATGDVHLARPLNPGSAMPSPLVIKRLHASLTGDEDFVRRFRHEAEVAVHVSSPYVAKVYGAGRVGDTLYIAMEYVPGWPLIRVLEERKKTRALPSVETAVELISHVLLGLEALHSAVDAKTKAPLSIVHRDVSPKNVMLGEDGRARLIDLGLGKSAVQDWKTRTGVVMGTIGYMSPEQIAADPVDLRSDLYVAAILLYELLTLEHYIQRASFPVMLKASLRPEQRTAAAVRSDVPPALEVVLARALEVDRTRRFESAREMAAALRSAVRGRVSAAEVRALADEELLRELADSRTQVTALVSKTWAREPELVEDTAVVFAERTTLKSDTMRSESRPELSKRWINTAAMIAMLGAGIAIGRVLWSPGEEVQLIEPAPVVDPIVVDPRPQVVDRPQVVARPAPVAEATETPVAAEVPPAAPRDAAPKKLASKRPIAPPVQVDSPPDARAVLARARSLRTRVDGEKAKAVDRLISRLVLEAGASDERAAVRVASLAAELDALEK